MRLLTDAVAAAGWVTDFGAEIDFGIGDLSNPYVRLTRAECMLAALVLHVEGRAVDFIDADRVEVLKDAPTAAQAALVADTGGHSSGGGRSSSGGA